MPPLPEHARRADRGASPFDQQGVSQIPAGASGEARGFRSKLGSPYKRGTQCSMEGGRRTPEDRRIEWSLSLFFFHPL